MESLIASGYSHVPPRQHWSCSLALRDRGLLHPEPNSLKEIKKNNCEQCMGLQEQKNTSCQMEISLFQYSVLSFTLAGPKTVSSFCFTESEISGIVSEERESYCVILPMS